MADPGRECNYSRNFDEFQWLVKDTLPNLRYRIDKRQIVSKQKMAGVCLLPRLGALVNALHNKSCEILQN